MLQGALFVRKSLMNVVKKVRDAKTQNKNTNNQLFRSLVLGLGWVSKNKKQS